MLNNSRKRGFVTTKRVMSIWWW